MIQYNSWNVKLSNSQINKLKSAIKNETGVVLWLSSNVTGNPDDNLMIIDRQLSKMIQSGGFLGRFLGPFLKTRLHLIKNVIKPLAKKVLIPLALTAAASAADARTKKKILCSGTTTLIISNDGMEEIIKIVKYLEDSSLLLKGVSERIQREAKEQKEGFLSVLLGTLSASLLGNILAGKGINRAEEGMTRAGYGSRFKKKLIPP